MGHATSKQARGVSYTKTPPSPASVMGVYGLHLEFFFFFIPQIHVLKVLYIYTDMIVVDEKEMK